MADSFIYLDYAAATPMSASVRAAMEPYLSEQFYNPSATYLPAQQVRRDLDAARQQIAAVLGARPAEVIFTAGASEANNLVIRGVLEQFPDCTMVTTAIEHDSVIIPGTSHQAKIAPVDVQGIVDTNALLGLVDDQTVLVSVMYANNEIGTVQPIRDIGQQLDKIRATRKASGNTLPLYFHSDAAQAANYLDLHVSRLGVDFLTINGSKLYGPKQSGMLYVKAGSLLAPQISGGGQERGLRSGTENVAGCIGLATALTEAVELREAEVARLKQLQQTFIRELQAALPDAVINGSLKKRLPNNIHITLPGTDNERVLLELEQAGILAAAGSACSASSQEPSHVLRAMGISVADAQSSLRFSMGRSTSETDILTTVAALAKLFV